MNISEQMEMNAMQAQLEAVVKENNELRRINDELKSLVTQTIEEIKKLKTKAK